MFIRADDTCCPSRTAGSPSAPLTCQMLKTLTGGKFPAVDSLAYWHTMRCYKSLCCCWYYLPSDTQRVRCGHTLL